MGSCAVSRQALQGFSWEPPLCLRGDTAQVEESCHTNATLEQENTSVAECESMGGHALLLFVLCGLIHDCRPAYPR